jgi:ketosteroid isomerase-like protein
LIYEVYEWPRYHVLQSPVFSCRSSRFVDNIILKMSGKTVQKKSLIPVFASPDRKKSSQELERERIMKTIHTLYDAYINKDIDAYTSLIADDARFWCTSYNLKGLSQIRNYRLTKTFVLFDNFEYDLKDISITITDDTATLNDTYVLKYTIKSTGRRINESARERFSLVRKGNSWYILENQEY